MRHSIDVCGCFPTGRHYPGIADLLARTVTHVEGLSDVVEASAKWAEQKLAVIDFETTGLSASEDRILEVGVACFDGGELTDRRNWLINPGIPVPEESRAIHNISDEDLKSAPFFADVTAELRNILAGRLPVAYNAVFDRGFLHAEVGRLGPAALADGRRPPAFEPSVTWIDPLVWVRELHQAEKGMKLTDVCARLGIALDNAHRAAADAEATGHVLLALRRQMPVTYGELIRIQDQYLAHQDVDMSANWRGPRRRN